MIKKLAIAALVLMSMACSKDFTEEPLTGEVALKKAKIDKKDKTKKKGIGLTYKNENWSSKVSDLKVEWHYSWGYYYTPKEPENVQYVPMDWGGSIKNDAMIDYLIQKKNTGEARYVLGFNEPDGKEQANMSVEKALELWPRLEQIGLPLGSPATVNPENEWMQSFMSEVENRGLRVDFVCVHHYGGISAQGFLDKLERVYNLYQRPIWITEFAAADWSAVTPADNKYTPEQVLGYMQDILPALDTIKYIERYAWFPAKQSNKALTSSALFDDETGELTALGEYYAHHKHNMRIGDGKDDFVVIDNPDNIILNGNFECGDNSNWGGYNSKTVGVVTSQPHNGTFFGQINKGEGSFVYNTSVTPGVSYNLSVWNKWATTPPGNVKVVIKNAATNSKLHELILTASTNWSESINQFNCPEGVENVKIIIWKPTKQSKIVTPALYIDDVALEQIY